MNLRTRAVGQRGPQAKCEAMPPADDMCARLLDLLTSRGMSLTNIAEHFLAVDNVKVYHFESE